MFNRIMLVACLIALSACGIASKHAGAPPAIARAMSEITQIKDLAKIDDALATASNQKTLLVLDIDDTLLTSSTYFGSDKWYERQKTLRAGDPQIVACKFDVIALNYEAGTQEPTEPTAPGYINQLKADKILPTSRSWLYRAATVRELERARYELPAMLGPADPGAIFRWRSKPADRLTTVSYDRGLFMTTGQDKGRILVDLLKMRGLTYDHVILVDDGRRNIDAMQAALADAGIGYHGLWYTRIDKTVSPAEDAEGVAGWEAWKAMMRAIFPKRLSRFEAGECAY